MDDIWENIKSEKPFFIAEAGVNHLCSIELGERLIKGARDAGADAIKFQSYKAETLCVKGSPRFWDWNGEVKEDGCQFDSYSELDKFGEEEHLKLKEICDREGIIFMSTPFDFEAVDYLDRIGTEIYKIASCDITNFSLIEHIASKKKIVMLSTGASNMYEIIDAVNIISKQTERIVIMHCNLKYPTEDYEINLGMITDLDRKFGDEYVIGLSDHTMNTLTSAFAYMIGASVFEKHFTVDKTLNKSADHWLSADISEMKEIISNANLAHTMYGESSKMCTESEERTKKFARRSIVASKRIEEGDILSYENTTCKRPGTGISPIRYKDLIGREVRRNLEKDELIAFEDLML